ncbi:MAG: FAD-dependent oxidoreductase [Candidatus Solibacter usitatus]|nr:FAD-dependent oxidoreductase [Candidatus Solibacter usitatus]
MRLVIVGGVAAGLSAASRARRVDRGLEIVVLEKGGRISYGACGLPYLVEGQVSSLDELTVHTPEFFERERDIRIRTGCEVASVAHAKREVVLASGERVRYDRLVWAAGARPAANVRGERVFTLHNDRDAERLQAFLRERRPRTAAVVGGGYIGLEMATALRARGLAVTLYHDGLTLLNREEPWLTEKVSERLQSCGVTLRLNAAVAAPDDLGDDFVLWTAGLKPNVEILAEAGAELGRTGALRVSEHMETSLGGVYAAGDCCEAMHRVTGRPVWLPLGATANKMGRVAGANAAGARERFEGITGTSIVRIGGLAVAMTGLGVIQARREGFTPVETLIEARDRPKYFRGRKVTVQLVADRGSRRLLGGAICGDEGVAGRINVVATALAARMTAADFASLDLAYAPPYAAVADPLLVAAQSLVKALDGR